MEKVLEIKLVLIGESGVGKSQFGNFILKNEDKFFVGDEEDAMTQEIAEEKVEREGLLVTVVDTPGLNDPRGRRRDLEIMDQIIDYFKKNKDIDAISLIYSFSNPRKFESDKKLLANLIDIFDKEVLQKRINIVVTSSPNSQNISRRESEKRNKMETNLKSLIGQQIGKEPNVLFVNTDFIPHNMELFQNKVAEMLKNISNIKKRLGSMDKENIGVIYKRKQEEERQRKENERRKIDNLYSEIYSLRNELYERERKEKEEKEKAQKELLNKKRKAEALEKIYGFEKEMRFYDKKRKASKAGEITSLILTPITLGLSIIPAEKFGEKKIEYSRKMEETKKKIEELKKVIEEPKK